MLAISLLLYCGDAISKEYRFETKYQSWKSFLRSKEKFSITIPDSWKVETYDSEKDATANNGGFEYKCLLFANDNINYIIVKSSEAISDNSNDRSFKVPNIIKGKVNFAPKNCTLIKTDIPKAPLLMRHQAIQYFRDNDGTYIKALIIAKRQMLYTIYISSKTEDFSQYDDIFNSIKYNISFWDRLEMIIHNIVAIIGVIPIIIILIVGCYLFDYVKKKIKQTWRHI